MGGRFWSRFARSCSKLLRRLRLLRLAKLLQFLEHLRRGFCLLGITRLTICGGGVNRGCGAWVSAASLSSSSCAAWVGAAAAGTAALAVRVVSAISRGEPSGFLPEMTKLYPESSSSAESTC
jgi:hypothetical protein